MQLSTGLNVTRNKKTLVSDIINFFEERDYYLSDADVSGMEFRRGNLAGSFTSFNPLKWRTIVTIKILKKNYLNFDLYAAYRFNTSGKFITSQEKHYFSEEINAFRRYIYDSQSDSKKSLLLAQKIVRTNYRCVLLSFIIGIILALVIIFVININLVGSLSIFLSAGITAGSIILSRFFVVKLKIS